MRKLSALICTLVLLAVPAAAFASGTPPNNTGANGYNVFPLLNSLVVPQGTSKTVTVYVQNISHATEQVQTIVNDFIAAPSNDGTPELLLNGQKSSHSLKQFVVVKGGNFTINPGQQASVQVVITIPKNTESGGYFGAVRFAPQGIGAAKNINLSGSVVSLILITVPGNLRVTLNIAQLGAGDSSGNTHIFFTSDKNIYGVVNFNNTGNVQVQPFGNFDLRKGSNNLGNTPINKGAGYILPGSQRIFKAKLSGLASFGKYTLYGNFGYGTKGELLSGNTTFYIVPLWLLILAPLAIVLIVFLIVFAIIRRKQSRVRKLG